MSDSAGNMPPSLLNSLPSLQPPAGIQPNFITPEDRGSLQIIVPSVLLSFVLLFYVNRIYTKIFILQRLNWDDLTCSLGLIGGIAYYCALIWVVTKGPVGKHQWDVTIAAVLSKDYMIPDYLLVVLTSPTMLFVKLTFFLLYLQIFQPLRWLRVSTYIGATALCAFYGACTIVQFVFATPTRDETWQSHTMSPDELKTNILSVPLSAVGLLFDIVILALPIAVVMHLQLPTRRKIGIALIFATGLLYDLACICSLLSLYYRILLNRSSDYTWNVVNVEVMVIVEIYLGIMCSCMPAFSKTIRHHLPLFKNIRANLHSYFSNTRFNYSKSGSSHTSSQTNGKYPTSGGVSKYPENGTYPDLGITHSKDSEISVQPTYEFGQLQSVRTFIGTTQGGAALDDKIHLTHEIFQRG